MAFESFYGGRQGASFVIVKRFDAIDLEKPTKALLAITDDPISEAGLPTYWFNSNTNKFIEQTEDNISEYTWYTTELDGSIVPVRYIDSSILSAANLPDVKGVTPYKGTYLAITDDTVNSDGLHTYLYDDINDCFIERNSNNYPDYYWNFVVLDGSSVPIKNIDAGTYSTHTLPTKGAEGMVQCFKQGGETTDIVNYGEYVIIDTPHKSDPDNGKVYRRGLFYDDKLGGAEYIGQIVGPEGPATEITIGHEKEIKENPNHYSDSYSASTENKDLIPGKEVIDDQVVYNDEITYSWVTLRDKYGHIQTALIGFTIPYFVLDFSAEGVSPYYNLNPDGTINPNIDLINRIDDKSHPFYENWKLHIPHGIKGDSIVDVELVNTTSQIDSICYKDPELTIQDGCTNKYAPIINLDQIDFKTAISLPIDIDGTIYYIENDLPYHKNTTTAKLRYKKYNYDKNAIGEYEYVEIAPYNVVRSMWVDPDGDLFADYTHINIQNLGKIKLVKGTFGIVQIWANQSLLMDDNPDPEARVAIPPEYMNYARAVRNNGSSYIFEEGVGYDDRYIGWIAGVDPPEGAVDQYPSFYYYDYTATKEEDKWNFIGMLDGSMYDPETIFAIREINDDPKDILREKGVWALAEKRKAI